MTLDASIAQLTTHLLNWSRFPKYALERRLDIFLTPFIGKFVEDQLGGGTATLVAPEFPILARLDPERKQRKSKKPPNLTVNLDYLLLHENGEHHEWIFFELKTDARSFDTGQLRLYQIAQRHKLAELLGHLTPMRKRGKYKAKYEHLCSLLEGHSRLDSQIRIVYLSPEPEEGFPEVADDNVPRTLFLTFADFLKTHPKNDLDLWRALNPLMMKLSEIGRVRPASSSGA